MSELKLQDVVWAKVRSYPWWPGIITEIEAKNPEKTLYRVDLISENSQYSLLSHILPKKYVKLFEGNIELPADTEEKTSIIKDLQKAMVIAHKINSGELRKSDLFEINQAYFSKDLANKKQEKEEKKSRLSSLEKKIEDLARTRNFIPEDKDFDSAQVLNKQEVVQGIEKKLIGFMSGQTEFCDISKEDLLEALEEFLDNDPTGEVFNNVLVMKSLKYFFQEFIGSPDHQLVMLAKIAKRLYFYWRTVGLEACVEDIKKSHGRDLDKARPVKKRKYKEGGKTMKKNSDSSED